MELEPPTFNHTRFQMDPPKALALIPGAAYDGPNVDGSFINTDEKIDRFVGRRTKAGDALSPKSSTRSDAIAWRKALGGVYIPRGVHRFKTHEEADQWLWRMISRPRS